MAAVEAKNTTSGGGLLLNPGQINVIQDRADVQPIRPGDQHRVPPRHGEPLDRALVVHARRPRDRHLLHEPRADDRRCPANTGRSPSGTASTRRIKTSTSPFLRRWSCRGSSSPPTIRTPDKGPCFTLHYSTPTAATPRILSPKDWRLAELEVTNPMPGKWTAVFFTETTPTVPPPRARTGPIQWSAGTYTYVQGGNIVPSTLFVGPGQTAYAHLSLTSSNVSGDSSQSVVVTSPYGTTTVPVTVRTTVHSAETVAPSTES